MFRCMKISMLLSLVASVLVTSHGAFADSASMKKELTEVEAYESWDGQETIVVVVHDLSSPGKKTVYIGSPDLLYRQNVKPNTDSNSAGVIKLGSGHTLSIKGETAVIEERNSIRPEQRRRELHRIVDLYWPLRIPVYQDPAQAPFIRKKQTLREELGGGNVKRVPLCRELFAEAL